MYTIACTITGTAPLLQHKFSMSNLSSLMEGARRKTGAPDYALQWLETMYTDAGQLVQPAAHLEAALVRAAGGFRIKGSRNQTYRDMFRAYVLIAPDLIPHTRDGQPIAAPGPELLQTPTDLLCINIQRVIVSRAAVARARLQINSGWELAFTITVNDDQIRPEVVQAILEDAGRAVGIGDYRPKYGRFLISRYIPHPDAPA